MTDYAMQAADRWAELASELDAEKLRIGIRFSLFSRERERALDEALSPFGAKGVRGMEDFRLLALLVRIDPEKTTATNASRLMNISKAATAARIARFESDGLVDRLTLPHDKRVVEVGITPAGRRLAQDCVRVVASLHDQLLADLTTKQLSQLDSVLRRLV